MSTELQLSDAGFTVLGALISAAATYFASKRTWQNLHFNDAANLFADAFVPEIIALRRARKDVYLILSDTALERHECAFVRFRHHLSESQRDLLQEAWEAYTTSLHTASPGNITNRPTECADALARIEKMLTYAKHR